MYLTVYPLHGPGSIPGPWLSIPKDFSLADHTLPTSPESNSILRIKQNHLYAAFYIGFGGVCF